MCAPVCVRERERKRIFAAKLLTGVENGKVFKKSDWSDSNFFGKYFFAFLC